MNVHIGNKLTAILVISKERIQKHNFGYISYVHITPQGFSRAPYGYAYHRLRNTLLNGTV